MSFMKKTKRYIAAIMAAVVTAASSAAIFSNAADLTGDNSEVIAASATQADALRALISEYITKNNIDAWIIENESMPQGIVFIGYYRNDENIPVDIVTYAQSKGYDSQLINFVQEDHKKAELIEDTEVIKSQLSRYISYNKLNARIVPEFELLDDADKSCVYVEYKADKTAIPDMLADYMTECKADTELVVFGAEGSLSKQSENLAGITFDEFRQLTTSQVRALFDSKGMNGRIIWTAEKAAQEMNHGRIDVLLQANPFTVSNPEIADDYSVCWEQERFGAGLGLPEVLFDFVQGTPVTFAMENDEGVMTNNEYCSCHIVPKTENAEEEAELMAAALNYVQLTPYFELLYFDYLGYSSNPTVNVKGDANCDNSADMADVVLVMQSLSNPDKYGENGTAKVHLTAQGKKNADMNGDGLTVGDAKSIQEMLLNLK
jgi:hypothetical protein